MIKDFTPTDDEILMKTKILILLLCALQSSQSFGWGQKGHEITVQIAEKFLSKKAKAGIRKILKKETLTQGVFWPDRVAYTKDWKHTQPWHYINVTDEGQFTVHDSHNPENILSALRYCVAGLGSEASTEEKATLLKFFIHFLGDIHQPLHAGRKDDEGGNKISVFFIKKTNLHAVWDTGIIEKQGLTTEDYVARLVSQNRSTEELKGDFQEIVLIRENLEHRPFIYSFSEGTIDEKYEARALEIIDGRLWTGGIRLAAELNRIFK